MLRRLNTAPCVLSRKCFKIAKKIRIVFYTGLSFQPQICDQIKRFKYNSVSTLLYFNLIFTMQNLQGLIVQAGPGCSFLAV